MSFWCVKVHNSASARNIRDDWVVGNWAAVPGSKRERSVRTTDMWPAVKHRRQVRRRSPTKRCSDRHAKHIPEISLEAVET
eukprot:931308-Prymnesium_polylepis.1